MAAGTNDERFGSPLSVESALVTAYVYEEVSGHDDQVLRLVASFLPFLRRLRRNVVFGKSTYRAGVEAIIKTAKVSMQNPLRSVGVCLGACVRLIEPPYNHHQRNRP